MQCKASGLEGRNGASRAMVLVLVAGLAAALPASASATTIFFNGPSGMGIAEADALSSGLPIITPDFVGESTGTLSVISQQLDFSGFDPSDPRATSTWTVQNESSFDLLGWTYLLFVTSDAYVIDGQLVLYDDGDVGLSVDPDDGWVLVRATEGQKDYYYPAVSLGSLYAGETAVPFEVHYVIDGPAVQVHTGSRRSFTTEYVLPQLQNGMGFTLIPEPGTAALLAAGLIGLGAMRRRRP